MHTVPWDIIASIIIAAFGSQWVGQIIMERHRRKTQPSGAEIIAKIDGIETKIDTLEQKIDATEHARQESDTNEMRWKILTFDGELQRKVQHTGEEFVEIMRVIDEYESYCDSHPEYHNSRAKTATKNIKSVYENLKN